MTIRSPQDGIVTTWEAKKNLLGRPVDVGTELLQIASTQGEWLLEVEVPDDDMAPILAAKRQLEEDIDAGRKKKGDSLKAYFVTMTDPEHRYDGFVRRIAPSAENVAESEQYKNRHVVKVTIGFPEEVRQRLPEAQPDPGNAARCRGPRPRPLRPDQPGLFPAPQTDPGLLRVGDVPLAVPALTPGDEGRAIGEKVPSAGLAPGPTPLDPYRGPRSCREPSRSRPWPPVR